MGLPLFGKVPNVAIDTTLVSPNQSRWVCLAGQCADVDGASTCSVPVVANSALILNLMATDELAWWSLAAEVGGRWVRRKPVRS